MMGISKKKGAVIDPDLNELGKLAGCSAHHFQRIFTYIGGITLTEYIRKRRMSLAAAEYMWVEHGTANPNARGFWNKYFLTYEYELVRTIN